MENTVVLGLSSSKTMADDIKKRLGLKCKDPVVKKFADGEIYIRLQESVRGKNVYLVQSTSAPVNDAYMELMIAIDACRRASAYRINVVMPYMGYARQDRKAKSREPITAKVMAALLETVGVHRIITFDLHASQIQGFFKIPVDDLESLKIIAEQLSDDPENKNPVVVSPDHGGSKRARKLADMLGCNVAVIDKSRPKANEVEIMGMIGDVKGKDAIIIDDMIDTGGTICKAAEKVMEEGANSVIIAATHGVFSGPARERLQKSVARKVVIANTIWQGETFPKLEIVSLSDFVSAVIKANEEYKSVGDVFAKFAKDSK